MRFRRDFRVKMRGTSSPEDKLAGDLGNVIEATSIGGRRSDFFTAGKLAPGNLGLLQQYLHKAAEANDKAMSAAGESRHATVPDVSAHQRCRAKQRLTTGHACGDTHERATVAPAGRSSNRLI
jgi:hypothetical protein